jgi:hypothetical protein
LLNRLLVLSHGPPSEAYIFPVCATVQFQVYPPLVSLGKNWLLSRAILFKSFFLPWGSIERCCSSRFWSSLSRVRNLYGEQGSQKISALLEYIRQHGGLGQMIWEAIQWGQVTAVVGFAFVSAPWRFLLHAVGKWFSFSPRRAIVNICTVCLLRRVHDRILMDNALARWYANSGMQAINRCRLHLQVECHSGRMPFRYLHNRRTQRRSRTSSSTTYCHFTEHDQVALPRASWLTLVGSMASLPRIHTLHRPTGYARPYAHGHASTSGLGLHTTSQHDNCSAR